VLVISLMMVMVMGCDTQDGIESLPFYAERTFTPDWTAPEALPRDFHRVPDFSLTDQRGEAVTEADMDGNITVVNYFFATCSGICPKLSASMKAVDAAFGEDAALMLLSHSATPDKDTVEALASFAQREGVASGRWHLLTGERSLIYRLGREAYFIEEDLGEERSEDDFIHSENIVLLDGERRLRGVYSGLNPSAVQQLIRDIATLMEEG
jgi:protein SCO1/2